MKSVFITGATGYMGNRLVKALLKDGYRVIALTRKGSEHKLPTGTEIVIANPFDSRTFQDSIPQDSVFVQLLGVSKPSPAKAQQFKEVDLRSVKASADAASLTHVSQFIYVSVAMAPSRIMRAYQQVRQEGEEYCLIQKLNCTFVRPWYVLGPGHWWPIILLPFYGLAELVPSWRRAARAKGLVTIQQMLATLAQAVAEETAPLKIYEIADIRSILKKESGRQKTEQTRPSYL
jgi:uncharacterized protein YbjT (DUF2867 family)